MTLYYGEHCIDALKRLPPRSVQTCITSPPYWMMRVSGGKPPTWADGYVGHLGSEPDPDQYATHLVEVFRAVKRVLAKDGTVFLNLGDVYTCRPSDQTHVGGGIAGTTAVVESYDRTVQYRRPAPSSVGLKSMDLSGIPWRVANALRADRWHLRAEVIWYARNRMPSRSNHRPLLSHETIFLLSRQRHYFFDREALPAEFKRSVWEVPVAKSKKGHPATWPEGLVEPMVLAGSRVGDCILDPFAGTGTTGAVATRFGRRFVGVDLDARWLPTAVNR
jgi:site-specific DNA-methyltransferase (cytosine-N4-specific)